MARNDVGFCVSVDIVYEVTMRIISRFKLFVEDIMIFDVVCIISRVFGDAPAAAHRKEVTAVCHLRTARWKIERSDTEAGVERSNSVTKDSTSTILRNGERQKVF